MELGIQWMEIFSEVDRVDIPFIDLKAQYQSIKDEIQAAFDPILNECQFIMGPAVAECEKGLADYTGSKFVLSCSSGTDALVMALMALDVGFGDEVIVPGFSFFATAEAVTMVGATPVFVDIDPKTCNLDPQYLDGAKTDKTKAVIVVGLYGQPADMDEINAWAKSNGVFVVEDGAQSFGGTYKGKKSGVLGDIGCTSFFPAKPLGCYGDGGAVFTEREDLNEAMRQIRSHGEETRYVHGRLGINGRMDTLQCAVINVKLPKFPAEIDARQKLADSYSEAFSKAGIVVPFVKDDRTTAWAQYTIRVKNRSEVQKRLGELGVPTAIHYPRPMYAQKCYESLSGHLKLEHCEAASEEVLSLPMHPFMTDEHRDYVIDSVIKSV